ncbi:MAG: hypothetical protein M3Y18_08330 [Candidatus Eremiobacteraeota bacterium]|nr:hypothetical protein [Candidatus Eremiobacteraeota bacterium]
MKKNIQVAAVLAAIVLTGCGKASESSIGLVDVNRLSSNWPKYTNYANQFSADEQAIMSGRASNGQKRRQAAQLAAHQAQVESKLVKEVRDAATQVANEKHLKLVVTREFVGYGGTDITLDVEKILGIAEKATPSP